MSENLSSPPFYATDLLRDFEQVLYGRLMVTHMQNIEAILGHTMVVSSS